VEGRKKKPEYVATVTRSYRGWLDAIASGEPVRMPAPTDVEPLVQIFSRGNTGGMYGGRQGREYITRTQPDNRGVPVGTVVDHAGGEIVVEVSRVLAVGDGIGFEAPDGLTAASVGGTVQAVRALGARGGTHRLAIAVRSAGRPVRVDAGWRIVRTSDVTLLAEAQATFASVPVPARVTARRVDVRCFGHAGGPLKTLWRCGDVEVTVRGEVPLAPASKRSLDAVQLREQLGRLGGTPFRLGSLDLTGLAEGLFLPVSELNRLRQEAVAALEEQVGWVDASDAAIREAHIASSVAHVTHEASPRPLDAPFALRATVYDLDTARAAAAGGATEIVLDPFLRHPAPPVARVRSLEAELASAGIALRLRTPSIVRPTERRALDKWMALELPLLSGHLGLVAAEGGAGRDVVADYAVNAFNPHTAAFLFEVGASRITASIELTVAELALLVAPWRGVGFDVVAYGRPEGMTIEHCVLSAAFDREPTTCRDLCVQKHPVVSITDPAGYTFAVATDSACRNRLLHSRPIDASAFLSELWSAGIRGYQLLFNVPDDPVEALVRGYRDQLEALQRGETPDAAPVRALLGGAYTRGHFARAV
jgi:putative protease